MKKELNEYALKIAEAEKAFQANSAARASVGKNISQMADKIKAINSSIKEVQNISMQTKILSLNASVEAARAGSAGRGFSVVASEINSLSQSTDATVKLIEASVLQMQKLLSDAVNDMTNAKALGAEFEKQLKQCVDEASRLSLLSES